LSNNNTLPPKIAAPWLHDLLATLDKLENAAGSENALVAVDEALSQLNILENSIGKLPPAEKAVTLPHLPVLMARLDVAMSKVKAVADQTGEQLSKARTRAAAVQKYGSVK
jgi:hypothetical protein